MTSKDGESPQAALFKRFLCSALSSSIAEFSTFPLDTLKVTLQANKGSGSLAKVFGDLVAKRGVTGFYQGLSPALVRGVVYGGINASFYSPIRRILCGDIVGRDILPLFFTAE